MKNLLLALLISATTASCTQKEVTKYVEVPIEKTEPEKGRLQGTINGGGGKGVLCSTEGKKWVELLDLYEAKALFDLEPIEVTDDENENIIRLSKLAVRHFWNPDTIPQDEGLVLMTDTFTKFRESIKFLARGQKLHKIDDSFEMVQDENCEVVQVAAYLDESVLVVDSEYWELMRPLDQLGLLLHEIIYLQARQDGAINSIQSRKFVGHLLSKKGLTPRAHDIPTDKYYTCTIHSEDEDIGYFYAYASEDSKVMGLTFNSLKGHFDMLRIFAKDIHADFKEFFSPGSTENFEAEIFVDTYPLAKKRIMLFWENSKIFARLYDVKEAKYSEQLEVFCDYDPQESVE